jgi:L-lactate dehydrogenase complex protein LldG
MTDPLGSDRETRRTAVLARIADALIDRPAERLIPRDYQHALPAEVDLLDLLSERIADYRATVHRTGDAGIATTIAGVVAARGISRLVVPAGIPGDWLAESGAESVGDDPPLSVEDLDAIDGTVTTCAVAIAETGTFVLDAGPGQGRRVLSLLPDRLICVIAADRVVGTVPEALARLDPRRPQTWVSGPSATSDIELERVEGVHGPRVLDVIVVNG